MTYQSTQGQSTQGQSKPGQSKQSQSTQDNSSTSNGDTKPAPIDLSPGHAQQLLSTAYSTLQAALAESQTQLQAMPDISAQDRAEGYQYIAGLLSWSLEKATTHANPQAPYFMRWFDSFRKFGLENPDNYYVSAEIDGQGQYRLSGTWAGAADIVWQVLDMNPGDAGLGRLVSSLDLGALQMDADGNYEIWLGAEPRAGNWLKLDAGACVVLGRQCFSDWEKQKVGAMQLERMDNVMSQSPPLTPEVMAASLERAAAFIRNQMTFWQQYIEPWCQRPANTLSVPKQTEGGVANQMIATGWVQLQPGEALLVEVPFCAVRYQGFQLGHRWWFNTFDYRCRQTSLNGSQARLSSDGIYRYVISVDDPGVHNWLDMAGHQQALISIRWQGISEDLPQAPRTQVIHLQALRDYLPMDEPVITQDKRQSQLLLRRKAIDRRFGH